MHEPENKAHTPENKEGSTAFTPELQDQVGDGADEQPGADGAPLDEDYDHDPEVDDDSDDDVEGEGEEEGPE